MSRPLRLPLALAAAALAATGAAAHGQASDPAATRIDTAAIVLTPSDVAVRPDGDLLVVDTSGGRVVRVDAAGTVTTLLDGLDGPRGVAALPAGGFLVADTGNHRIVRVAADGSVAVAAGPASATSRSPFASPGGVAALADGGFLVADTGNHRIRRVSSAGEITTVAGTGTAGLSGDGGPATSAQLSAPARVAALPGGGFLVADTGNGRIRGVDVDGRITTIAGQLARPEGVAARPDGNVLIADTGLHLVRELTADGALRTVAGTGAPGFGGDGGAAADAALSEPRAVAASGERILVADTGNGRIRRVEPAAPATAPDPTIDEPAADDVTADPPPGVAPPVLGRRAVASVVGGTVRVRLPGRRRFVALDAAANVPLGTEVDARAGTAAVFFVTDAGGRPALALAAGGRFVVRQPARLDRGQRPGVLRLSEPLHGCPPVHRASARAATPVAAAAAKRRTKRRLRVRAKGRIQTTGRYGSAIVRGTAWTIADRCAGPRAGTLVAVAEGEVAVRDRVRFRTVRVAAGDRYLARAPR